MRLDHMLLLLELMRRCLLLMLPGTYEEHQSRFVPIEGLLEGKGYVMPRTREVKNGGREDDDTSSSVSNAVWDGTSLFTSMKLLNWHVRCYVRELLSREEGLSTQTIRMGGVGMKSSQEGGDSPARIFSQNRLSWICDMNPGGKLGTQSIFILALSVQPIGNGKNTKFRLKLGYSKELQFDKNAFCGLIDGGICYLDRDVLPRLLRAGIVDRREYWRLLKILPEEERRLMPQKVAHLGRDVKKI